MDCPQTQIIPQYPVPTPYAGRSVQWSSRRPRRGCVAAHRRLRTRLAWLLSRVRGNTPSSAARHSRRPTNTIESVPSAWAHDGYYLESELTLLPRWQALAVIRRLNFVDDIYTCASNNPSMAPKRSRISRNAFGSLYLLPLLPRAVASDLTPRSQPHQDLSPIHTSATTQSPNLGCDQQPYTTKYPFEVVRVRLRDNTVSQQGRLSQSSPLRAVMHW